MYIVCDACKSYVLPRSFTLVHVQNIELDIKSYPNQFILLNAFTSRCQAKEFKW